MAMGQTIITKTSIFLQINVEIQQKPNQRPSRIF